MQHPNFTILYVDNPTTSGAFYAKLLGRDPVDASPTFVMFALESGLLLGLWARHTVEPQATATGGGGELAITLDEAGKVAALHDDWAVNGVAIAQTPTDMDFGRTFTALDPDGHRLRVFAAPQGR